MNRTASLAAWGFAALAFGLATVDCGSGLPGLDGYDLQFEGVIGQGFYSRSTDTHDLILSATIVNTKDGGGKLTRWSFSLVRRGETIATVDASNLAQYEFDHVDLDTDLDETGIHVYLSSMRSLPGHPFYGADPPDKVAFRGTVDKDFGGGEDLRDEGVFSQTDY